MITLIGTSHSGFGACNSDELYKIIEAVSPKIIFEEIPPSLFEAIYKGNLKDSLETYTIKKYLQKNLIDHFPVDLDCDQNTRKNFRDDYRKMTSVFNDYSYEYYSLSNEFHSLAEEFGFSYLNSEKCSRLSDYKSLLEKNIVKELKLEKLSLAHSSWLDYNERRENQMINSITSFIQKYGYYDSLFLIGAEHRNSIIKKIQACEIESKFNSIWNFSYFT